MEPIVTIAGQGFDLAHLILFFLALGAGVIAWMQISTARLKTERLSEQLDRATDEQDRIMGELRAAGERIKTLDEASRASEIALAQAQARSEEDKKNFAELAQRAVREAHGQFLERADERFGKLVEPIGKSFEKFEAKVEELGKDRAKLDQQFQNTEALLRDNREATGKLVTALSSPKGGGQWGEESLKRALDYAGLQEGIDYETQVTINSDRPDALIRLPNGRTIVIDAKVSASEFLLASQQTDHDQRLRHLQSHASHVRQNMKRLADKAYQKRVRETADFVVMYIPGENMFSSAIASDPALFEDAFRSGVVMASPSTLVALAKTVALGWREEQIARNAREVAELGRDLYQALATFGNKVQKIGTNLERSVKSYNEFVASLEGNVMPKGRKFKELGASQGTDVIEELSQVETSTRMLRVDRDMQLDVFDALDVSNDEP